MGKLEFWDLSGVSDEHLLRNLNEFVASGARTEARVVAHLAEVEERRLHLKAAASKPGPTERKPSSTRPREHIPSHIRRAVATRDDFRCTYVDGDGHRCPSRAFLQIHHQHAHALGGPSTLENLRLLCAAHNRLLAEVEFGRAHQERIAQRNRSLER